MKIKTFLSASRLVVMALACIFTLAFTACGGDDDDTYNAEYLSGVWERDFTNSKGETNTERYWFDAGGWGGYRLEPNDHAGIEWSVVTPGTIHIRYSRGSFSNGFDYTEKDHSYSVRGNRLTLDDKTFVKTGDVEEVEITPVE